MDLLVEEMYQEEDKWLIHDLLVQVDNYYMTDNVDNWNHMQSGASVDKMNMNPFDSDKTDKYYNCSLSLYAELREDNWSWEDTMILDRVGLKEVTIADIEIHMVDRKMKRCSTLMLADCLNSALVQNLLKL